MQFQIKKRPDGRYKIQCRRTKWVRWDNHSRSSFSTKGNANTGKRRAEKKAAAEFTSNLRHQIAASMPFCANVKINQESS